jgi:low density lipoprotein receptor-related protein 5/6
MFGPFVKELVTTQLNDPRAVALDVVGGWMFWSDWGKKPKIERAYMNGERREVLTDVSLGWPSSLTLDTFNKRVFWIDAKLDHMEVLYRSSTEFCKSTSVASGR